MWDTDKAGGLDGSDFRSTDVSHVAEIIHGIRNMGCDMTWYVTDLSHPWNHFLIRPSVNLLSPRVQNPHSWVVSWSLVHCTGSVHTWQGQQTKRTNNPGDLWMIRFDHIVWSMAKRSRLHHLNWWMINIDSFNKSTSWSVSLPPRGPKWRVFLSRQPPSEGLSHV